MVSKAAVSLFSASHLPIGVTRYPLLIQVSAFARFDMAVHNVSTHEKCLNLDPGAVFNDFMERLRLLPNPNRGDRGHPQADFHHLVSGMDAGYYSYLWYVSLRLSFPGFI